MSRRESDYNSGRTPDKMSRAKLLATLTLPERYSYDALMTTCRLARWLGRPVSTVNRWRIAGRFPRACGIAPSQGCRGGQARPHVKYKGKPGWRAAAVLKWLEATGRLAP